MSRIFTSLISKELNLQQRQVSNTIDLLSEGATIPFISRYRKERTGSLDEVEIGKINDRLKQLQQISKRKETILTTIDDQGKLTDELTGKIEDTWDATALEDIYLPYKPRRKTRASVAHERGLEPLAKILMAQHERNPENRAEQFVNNEVPTIEDAFQGARDIIAEWINENQHARNRIRHLYQRKGTVQSKVVKSKKEEAIKYKDYFDYIEPLSKIPSHRMLAIRRGEEEGLLRMAVSPPEEDALQQLEIIFLKNEGTRETVEQVKLAVKDGYKRLLQPSIETEFRVQLKEKADEEAIEVFAENLRQLLLAPPLGQQRILAIDPGFRTGCKVVCLDEQGNLRKNMTMFPHPPQNQWSEAQSILQQLVRNFAIGVIAIGNGTASRETENLVKAIDFKMEVEVFVVSEAGASVYSASEAAREEFPDQDVTVRGAVSIGRRLMDPLAELVKIDPKSIGVGQYQHDVDQQKLKKRLDQVVESCVNSVGVNLNTASKHLLNYISGLGPQLAQNIVDYRSETGAFPSRASLKKVPRLGNKAFEQAAGFLRILDAKNPLDNTAVHPESYPVVEKMAKNLGKDVKGLLQDKTLRQKVDLNQYVTGETGFPTLKDIMQELARPGRDPRGEAESFSFADVHTIQDLETGMILPGIVTNLTNFGCFVDIGVKQDGLVHISEIKDAFVKNPADEVKLQQQVQVKVLEVDVARKRIQLSMKQV